MTASLRCTDAAGQEQEDELSDRAYLVTGLQALERAHGAARGLQHDVGRDCGGLWT